MIITKKTLPRRTVLRGLGTAVALPLLDGMVPALTALSRTAARPKPRLGFVYVPHGAVMRNWTPPTEGTGFEFTPILKPLEPFRDNLVVLSNLDHAPAAQMPGDPAGGTRTHHRRLPDRRAREADRGRRLRGGRVGRPDRGGEARATDAARLAGGGHRAAGVRRRLRRRLQLRLHLHAELEHADDAAADGEQSARAVRAAVRRRHEHRPGGAARADAQGPQHPRRGDAQGGAPAGRAGRGGPGQADRLSRRGARRRAPHPAGRGGRRPRAAGGGPAVGEHSRPRSTSTSR